MPADLAPSRHLMAPLVSIVVSLLLAACVNTPMPTDPAATPAAQARAAVPPPPPEPAQRASAGPDRSRDYVVGSGDVLRINVYQNADLSLEARVNESGVISYPLLGQVVVGGRSVGEIEQAIADGLKKGNFIKQPQVSVLVTQVRGNQASVLGAAGRPGRYPIEVKGMRLSELLALAGGVAAGGSEIVTLSGIREGKPFRQKVDVSQLFGGNSAAEDPIVLNGDTLYVDKLPTVYIYGEVQRPGPIALTPDMTLMQALASGGGLTQRGTERGMKVHRRNGSGKVEIVELRMTDTLRPGDVIYVRESLF
ncbi:polysaccharide export protein EpsE [Rhizobacter sp. J219]|jgi:polysaccharide export outer membrane protein|uniref:polysaccharide export protein EpsE n=1 Tax=Rhizobacter sp. J219 TaxID=2898430 RepID=UPI002150788E|nr:polysaccharide export protein EpsE [Rhizobacter sp. J219]MCR5886055.1 polysaccharide export protein EpsE [Rhizobacter sp. J219]